MTKDRSRSPSTDDGSSTEHFSPEAAPSSTDGPGFTRASAVWVATGVALILLILLIVFILQNSAKTDIHFLGLSGTLSTGMAMLIAAVVGGVVVGIAGVARVAQLRMNARSIRRSASHG